MYCTSSFVFFKRHSYYTTQKRNCTCVDCDRDRNGAFIFLNRLSTKTNPPHRNAESTWMKKFQQRNALNDKFRSKE